MSWVQLLGETWRPTANKAELRVHLWPEDADYPRTAWCCSISHYNLSKTEDPIARWLDLEISNLHFYEPDWRRLSGLEIRADAAWHEAHEFTQEHGKLETAEVTAHYGQIIAPPGQRTLPGGHESWVGHDFILRLGTRDGLTFPLELDAWLIPEDEYYRQEPETSAEVARFAEGPPNLRVMADAVFTGGTVVLPRCGDDPLPLARRYLREGIACDEIDHAEVEWAVRRSHEEKETIRMPGWTSTVTFKTPY